MLILATLALAASPAAAGPLVLQDDQVDALILVELDRVPGLSVDDINAMGFDVASHTVVDGHVEIVANDSEQQQLVQAGIPFEVMHADLTAHLASRLTNNFPEAGGTLGSFLSPPFAQGSMGGYYDFSQIESVLDQITAAYPNITTNKFSIGTTGQGDSLWAVKVSDNPDVDENEPEVRFDAMHHAREPQSMMTTLWTLLYLVENYGSDPLATYLVDNREIWFLPCVNPDGYEYNRQIAPNGGGLWRKNRRNNGGGSFGVDLNRNYSFQWGNSSGSSGNSSDDTYRGPSAASEPEVAAMQAFIDSRSFVTALSSHSYSDLWLYPWGYTTSGPSNESEYAEISALATAINNYPYGPASVILYVANGVTFDYDHGVHGTLGWTPEIGSSSDNFWPPTSRIIPLAQDNELAFLRTAQAAGAFINVSSLGRTELGDGDGFFEAGEGVEWRYTMRNSGKSAPMTDVIVTLATTSGFATVTSSTANLGPVGSFTNADNNSSPLSLTIAGGTPAGTIINYTTTIDYEGMSDVTAGVLIVGQPRALIVDEIEVNLGWSAGIPGDTATTGQWEWGQPVGTNSG
ncbi:MAG: carboxypeptidase T, partial [Gammaproteobacteria bacterium]